MRSPVGSSAALRLLADWLTAHADYRWLCATNAPDDELGDAALRVCRAHDKLQALDGRDVLRWEVEQVQPTLTGEQGQP